MQALLEIRFDNEFNNTIQELLTLPEHKLDERMEGMVNMHRAGGCCGKLVHARRELDEDGEQGKEL